MHIRLLAAIIVTFTLFWAWHRLKKLPPKQRATLLLMWLSIAVVLSVFVAVVLGKMHWVGAIVAGLFTFGRFGFRTAMSALPLLRFWQNIKGKTNKAGKGQQHTNNDKTQNTSPPPQQQDKLGHEEALQVLGLSGQPDKATITKAHKRLIQKLHPDRGGNDYLASHINRAKDTLLKDLKTQA